MRLSLCPLSQDLVKFKAFSSTFANYQQELGAAGREGAYLSCLFLLLGPSSPEALPWNCASRS